MEKHQKKTIYQYTTSSERIARAVELLLKDQKAVSLLLLFANIKGSKRKNVVLRVAGYIQTASSSQPTSNGDHHENSAHSHGGNSL